jgi:hypothetical protein
MSNVVWSSRVALTPIKIPGRRNKSRLGMTKKHKVLFGERSVRGFSGRCVVYAS